MIIGVSILAAVLVLATIGYLIAGWTLGEATYMVVITVFAVGYGEVRPVTTWPLRSLTMALIVFGYGAVIYTVGGFIQLVVDGELNRTLGARKMSKGIDQLSGHTIICGYGRMGTTLAKELHAAGRPFVAIDTLGGASSNIDGADGFLVIRGDATEEDVLERAGIARANVLATVMSDDATNVFVTLTAREMNPDPDDHRPGREPPHREQAAELRRRHGGDDHHHRSHPDHPADPATDRRRVAETADQRIRQRGPGPHRSPIRRSATPTTSPNWPHASHPVPPDARSPTAVSQWTPETEHDDTGLG